MATYREIDRADLVHHSKLHEQALAAEMALFVVDELREYMRCSEDKLALDKRKDADDHSNEVDAYLFLDGETVRGNLSLRFTRKPHDPLPLNLAVTEITPETFRVKLLAPYDFVHVGAEAELSRKDSVRLAEYYEKVTDSILSFIRTAMD